MKQQATFMTGRACFLIRAHVKIQLGVKNDFAGANNWTAKKFCFKYLLDFVFSLKYTGFH